MPFLPVTKEEIEELSWDAPDFVLVTGDAYVDHPTFGTAIISRVLESCGYRVAILAQPDWHSLRDFQRFGCPKLGFLVNAGNLDSMVAHYTVAKRPRRMDAYSPGNQNGKRPDRAVT
ncbi:MAG: YgiQ family radical SAM protein, partial [Oscillospiraceae bacterium]|nr:YgiQ family radical SAM protein [Oscillospiraceae bacterium]